MFVVILGPLVGDVVSSNSALPWVAIMYVSYLAIGSFAFVRNYRLFGLTLMVAGFVAALAFYGFVYGVLT
jgi:hypothetical protein